jgi:hypothetical protein
VDTLALEVFRPHTPRTCTHRPPPTRLTPPITHPKVGGDAGVRAVHEYTPARARVWKTRHAGDACGRRGGLPDPGDAACGFGRVADMRARAGVTKRLQGSAVVAAACCPRAGGGLASVGVEVGHNTLSSAMHQLMRPSLSPLLVRALPVPSGLVDRSLQRPNLSRASSETSQKTIVPRLGAPMEG